jgi:hypothetical protein
LAGIFQLFNTWGSGFSMGYSDTAEVSGDNKLLLDIGLATVFVCGMLLAAFVATAVISREIENKTVLTVVSKPISRVCVVLGKYLGVAGAILVAVLTMVLFLGLAIRHGVMSTAADDLDQPVITFTCIAVALAMGVGVWGNFFYGWSFVQTATLLLCPLTAIAYVFVLLVSKKWHWQPIEHDFKPQIAIAALSIILAQLVLAAVATAASARLGQVMTIVVCSGVFMLGLLSNYFLGRRAFDNPFVARILHVAPESDAAAPLARPGDTDTITFQHEPRTKLEPGTSFYYSPNPNGFPMQVRPFLPVPGNVSDSDVVFSRDIQPALVVTAAEGRTATIRRVGAAGPDNGHGGLVIQPPQRDDYIFTRPTTVNPVALVAWCLVPNVQFFWLVDAVTQNQPVPPSHLALIAAYAVAQIGVFLSVAVALFQTREVG